MARMRWVRGSQVVSCRRSHWKVGAIKSERKPWWLWFFWRKKVGSGCGFLEEESVDTNGPHLPGRG